MFFVVIKNVTIFFSIDTYFCKVGAHLLFFTSYIMVGDLMKKWFLFFILFCFGCSNTSVLKCTYTDNNLVYGDSTISDTLEFKDDKLVHFVRENYVKFYNNTTSSVNSVYKIMKREGKLFKKYVSKSKYKVKKDSNSVVLSINLNVSSNSDLSSIGVDVNSSYDEMKINYSDMGFSCK